MGDPIIIRRPVMTVQALDPATGSPTGTPTDVSEDVASVTLTPSVATSSIKTFAGNFTSADEPEWGAATTAIVVNADTSTNWAPLVGERVEVIVKDRQADTEGRRFESEVLYNPALAGITQPGQARTSDFPLPVLSAVTIE
jgi:hypothetical protein